MSGKPRPLGVSITTLLMASCLVSELIEAKATLPILHGFPMPTETLTYLISYLVLPKAISIAVLFFYWRGRDWALWMVMAYALLTVTNLDILTRTKWTVRGPLNVVTLPEIALALFLLYFLNTRSTRAWFQ